MAENPDQLKKPVIIPYLKAIPNGIQGAIVDLVQTTINVIAHPIDELLYPTFELAQDFLIITAKHYETDNPSLYLKLLVDNINQNPEIHKNALVRMDRRVEAIKSLEDDFLAAPGPKKLEMLTKLTTTILVPGYALKGLKAINEAALNKYYFDSFKPQPKFDVQYSVPSPWLKLDRKIKKLSIDEIRKNSDLMYVINHKRELIITDFHYDHWHLGEGKPVYAAGDIRLVPSSYKKGDSLCEAFFNRKPGDKLVIEEINNRSGSYAPPNTIRPEGVGLKDLVENAFIKFGLPDAKGKYTDWRPNRGRPHTLSTINDYAPPSSLGFMAGAAVAIKPDSPIRFSSSSFLIADAHAETYQEPIFRIKKLINKASKTTGHELIKNVQKIENQINKLEEPNILSQHLTNGELKQLSEILESTEHAANQQFTYSMESFVDDVNAVFDKNYFTYKYQYRNQKSENIENFDPIPILHTVYNVFSFINEKEANRVAAQIISGSQIMQGIPEVVSAFSDHGIAGILDTGFSIGAGNILTGVGTLLRVFGKQKNPNAPIIKMLQGISHQIARLHYDVLEGFRQVFLTLGLMDLKMAYGFQDLGLLAKQQHTAAITILQNIQTFLGIDRNYLQGLTERLKRIELGLDIHEVDKEDWSPDLSKIDTRMAIYREEGINRREFYNTLIDLMELLQQSRIKSINRAKKVDVNSYYSLSRALSTYSSALGTEHSGHFEDITLSNQFRSVAEQQINIILKYVLSNRLSVIKNPNPLFSIEQFNPTALAEITQKIIQLISFYKKGVFCPADLAKSKNSMDCRLNKIEVLERLKQIQQYFNNYKYVISLLSDRNLIEHLIDDYTNTYSQFNSKARKLLANEMQYVYQEDITAYYNRLEQLALDLKLQQSLSIDIGTHLGCTVSGLGDHFSAFGHFEWVGLWPYGWRGRGWGVTCANWAPCGEWYGPGTLIDISKQRYIHDRKQAYHAALQKQIDMVETSIKSRNRQNLRCNNIYFSTNLTESNYYADCMPQIYFAYSSNPKLFNGKKIILPTDHPGIKYYIPEKISRYLIPGFSWLDFQYDIHNNKELKITPIWRNAKINESIQFPSMEYDFPVQPPFGLEEGLFYYWFGGDKPTGSCVMYDEGLKRPSSYGDGDAVKHYSEKLHHGTNWPAGNLVYTGGSGPGEAWMRLLFLRPDTETVSGVMHNPQRPPGAMHYFKIHSLHRLIKQKTEQFLIGKRVSFFKDYLMNLLLPDSSIQSLLTPDELEVQRILIELDAKAKLLKAIISLVVDFKKIDIDPILTLIFDKDNIIAYLNRYKGSLLTLFDQNDLNIKTLFTLMEKIFPPFSEKENLPSKPTLIDKTKQELDDLISIEENRAITPLEEAIYPGTEKDIVDNLNPLSLARVIASGQMASELVQRNPSKLEYLKPLLMQTNKIISDALGGNTQGNLLDNPDEAVRKEDNVNEFNKPQLRTSDTAVKSEDPITDNDESSPQSFFGIPMAKAEPIPSPNPQESNIVPPDTSSATKQYGIPILATIAGYFRSRTPSLFVNPKQSFAKSRSVSIKPLPLDETEIQDFDLSFDKHFTAQTELPHNDKAISVKSVTQNHPSDICSSGQAFIIRNKVTGASVVRMEGASSYNTGTGKNLIFVGPNSRASIKGFKLEDHLAIPTSNRHDGLPECVEVPQGSILSVDNENIMIGTDSPCHDVLPQIQPVSRDNPAEHLKAEMEFLKTPFFHSSLFLHGLAFIAAFRDEIAKALLLQFANGDQTRYESWQKGLKEFREKNSVKLGSDLSEMAARISIAKDLQVTENTTHIAKDFMTALMTAKQEPEAYLGLLARAIDEAAFMLDKAIPYVSITGITQILTRTYKQYVDSGSKMRAAHTLVDNLPLLIPGSRVLQDSLDKMDKRSNKPIYPASGSPTVELNTLRPAFGLRHRLRRIE